MRCIWNVKQTVVSPGGYPFTPARSRLLGCHHSKGRARVNRFGAPTLPKDSLIGVHSRRPSYRDAHAAVRVAIAYQVRERQPSRAPAMPLTSNPENRPAGMNQTAFSVTK
jgi:hypothetical protein